MDENEEPREITEADVTCRTKGCENADETIRVPVVAPVAEATVICGPCSNEIKDVKPVKAGG